MPKKVEVSAEEKKFIRISRQRMENETLNEEDLRRYRQILVKAGKVLLVGGADIYCDEYLEKYLQKKGGEKKSGVKEETPNWFLAVSDALPHLSLEELRSLHAKISERIKVIGLKKKEGLSVGDKISWIHTGVKRSGIIEKIASVNLVIREENSGVRFRVPPSLIQS